MAELLDSAAELGGGGADEQGRKRKADVQVLYEIADRIVDRARLFDPPVDVFPAVKDGQGLAVVDRQLMLSVAALHLRSQRAGTAQGNGSLLAELDFLARSQHQIGSASGRERGCQNG